MIKHGDTDGTDGRGNGVDRVDWVGGCSVDVGCEELRLGCIKRAGAVTVAQR